MVGFSDMDRKTKEELILNNAESGLENGDQLASQRVGRRFVILDRDGTINTERRYLSDPDSVELLPGAVEGLSHLQDIGLRLVVVTNQSAVGRGYFDLARLESIHARLKELLADGGVGLDGIYFCPHKPEDECECRKPSDGLVRKAAMDLGFKPHEGFVIGDKACDIELGQVLGAKTVLVTTGYGAETLAGGQVQPDFVAANLAEAAAVIEKLVTKDTP